MRILLTTDTIGGVWTFTCELIQEFLHQGHQVALVSFGRVPSSEQIEWCRSAEECYDNSFQYQFSTAPLEWMNENAHAYDEGVCVLLRVISSFMPDLVHSSQFCFGSLPIGIPVLITAHSDVLSWGAACRSQGLESSPWLERYVKLVQRGLACCNALSAPSTWMLEALLANFSVEAPACVISNGRSLAACQTDSPRSVQAITVGRLWDEGKNLGLLRRIQHPVPILVAGEQRNENSESPGVSADAEFLGALSQAALQKRFSESSIYLATSIYEPFGLAPLEAALCGCAVIANDLPSLREVWGDAALYFQDGPSLEHLLGVLKASPAMLSEARRLAYRRALEFPARKMADAYLALYQKLIQVSPEAVTCELAAHAG